MDSLRCFWWREGESPDFDWLTLCFQGDVPGGDASLNECVLDIFWERAPLAAAVRLGEKLAVLQVCVHVRLYDHEFFLLVG